VFFASLKADRLCELSIRLANAGIRMAARMPIMAITIISSIIVKPLWNAGVPPAFLCRRDAQCQQAKMGEADREEITT